MRRTALAASAASLALLASACGSSESGDKDDTEGKETASAAPAAKALTAAELEKLVLADDDVKNHKVEKPGAGDITAADDITVDKAACKPLAYAVSAVPLGEPAATAQRKVTEVKERPARTDPNSEESLLGGLDATLTLASLSSYDGKGAEEAVASLRTAATGCAGGFNVTSGADKSKVTKLKQESVSGGEEALAWTVTSEQDGEEITMKVVVVRQGTTLASFSAVNLGAVATGEGYALPTAVVEAQVAKLG